MQAVAKPYTDGLGNQHRKTPVLEPHVTLFNTEELTAEDAKLRLQTLKGAGPIAISFADIEAGADAETGRAPWNQTAVATICETPQLVELQRRVRCAFALSDAGAQAWASPLCKPHLSLAYGNAPSMLAELDVPAPFVADSVAVWDCSPATLEGVSGWHEIARVPL